MKYKVSFKNLGRRKAALETTTDHLDYSFMLKAVKPYLCSSEIDFKELSSEGNVTKGKVYVGGFRPVGEFEIEELETLPSLPLTEAPND